MMPVIRVTTCVNCVTPLIGFYAKCPHCGHEPIRACHDLICTNVVKGDVGTYCKSTGAASLNKNWREDCPDWRDFNDNNKIQVKNFSGEIYTGTVELYDCGFDGNDEYPIWHVTIDTSGVIHELFDFDMWVSNK